MGKHPMKYKVRDTLFAKLVRRLDGKHHPHRAMMVIACVVGLLAGAAAALLKVMIGAMTGWLHDLFHASGDGINYWYLALPIAGILLVGMYQRYVIRRPIEHGERRLEHSLKVHDYLLCPTLIYSPMIASTLTLGFGGSAGSEGPIAYTGAAIGSNIARLAGMSPKMMRIIVGCGAGAGIAGIFKAPIGGALFSIEVLGMELMTISVLALLLSCIISAATAYLLSGCTPDIFFTETVPFDYSVIPWILLLGLFCGFYSVYYKRIMHWLGNKLENMKNQWFRNVLSGAVIAICVFMFPALYGEGYGIVGHIINGETGVMTQGSVFDGLLSAPLLMLIIVGGTLLIKAFACASTNNGGGVAGDFAPTLFAGCMAGMLFALLCNEFLGAHLSVGNFALLGMGAVMAGVIEAPLMALFLVAEMALGYGMFVALLFSVTVSYGIVRMSRKGKSCSKHNPIN